MFDSDFRHSFYLKHLNLNLEFQLNSLGGNLFGNFSKSSLTIWKNKRVSIDTNGTRDFAKKKQLQETDKKNLSKRLKARNNQFFRSLGSDFEQKRHVFV